LASETTLGDTGRGLCSADRGVGFIKLAVDAGRAQRTMAWTVRLTSVVEEEGSGQMTANRWVYVRLWNQQMAWQISQEDRIYADEASTLSLL